MISRAALLLLLAAAACASAPVASEPPVDGPPLPRSSIVAVLAHRGELELSDEQAAALERADADLQVQLSRLRAEGGVPAQGTVAAPVHGSAPAGGMPPMGGPGSGGPTGTSGAKPGGFSMNTGPGGFQASPMTGGMGGGMGGGTGPAGAAPPGAPPGAGRRDPVKEQQALEARFDDADTRAFLKAEAALTPAQRDRAREIASGYREQLFDRRERQRGR